MRNLLSCLQSFAVRPTSVAVVAPRHGSCTLGLLSLHMAWKRLISNLNVVFQGAKKAAKAKKKQTPKKRWKTARRARSIFILIPEADNTVNKHRVLFSSKISLTARWGEEGDGDGKQLYSSSFREAPCHKFCMRCRIITQIHIFMPVPLLSTANLSAGEERKGRASCFLC